MIKKISVVVFSLLMLVIFTNAQAQQRSVSSGTNTKVRLVIKKAPMATVESFTGTHKQKSGGGYEIVEVDKDKAASVMSALKSQSGVESVEVDYATSVPKPIKETPAYTPGIVSQSQEMSSQGNSVPNDYQFINQYAWQKPTTTYKGEDNIENAYVNNTPKRKLNIAVLDSGFRNTTDLTWTGGYNFSTVDSSIPVGPNYLDYDPNNCNVGHGQAVAEIIGAQTNDGYGMAGIDNANMYAVRVLGCNEQGYLSEAAEGLRWAAGDTSNVSSAPAIGAKIDIVNMSLGAQSSTCPSYMQDAINYAVNKGVIVVVAAGNNSEDASNFTPANCNNVIVVGSVDRVGNESNFSNYGSKVDVSALGEQVLSIGTTSDFSYWFGTSFATPNVAGIIGLAKQMYPDMDYLQADAYLKETAGTFSSNPNYMGAGVVDAYAMQNKIINDNSGNTVSLVPMLKTGERCNSTLYVNSKGFAICQLYQVNINSLTKTTSQYYDVFKVPVGQSMNVANGTVVVSSQDKHFILAAPDIKNYQYGVQVCSDKAGTNCSVTTLINLNASTVVNSNSCP